MVKNKADINWNDPKAQISDHFTVHDATWLPTWQIHHQPSEVEKDNILKMCDKLEIIREYVERPVNVHVWIRPIAVNCPGSPWHGKNYNARVGGATNSAHITGEAVDWNPSSMLCDEARLILQPKLEDFQIRMEDLPASSNWVHCDIAPVIYKRFFKP